MEGIIGVDDIYDVQKCAYSLHKELSMYVLYLRNLIPEIEITICDCHNNGKTITAVSSSFSDCNIVSCLWNIDFSITYDFALLVGFHARAGTKRQFSHSFRPEISHVYISGKEIGELYLIANWLASHHIPLSFISGDEEGIQELKHLGCGKNCVHNTDLALAYSQLNDALIKTDFTTFSSPLYNSDLVEIRFYIPDMAKALGDLGYSFIPEQDSIVFSDTEELFNKMQQFCSDISKCLQSIYRKNSALIQPIIKVQKQNNLVELIRLENPALLQSSLVMIESEWLEACVHHVIREEIP